MAQDFGDDLGELLVRWVARRGGEALRRFLADYQRNAEQWNRQRFLENGMNPTQAQAAAQAAAAREAVCVPFGGAQDAALFAQMCRQDGVYAMPLTDPQGNGFLQFAVADLDRMQSTISRFAQEVARQHEQWIGETLRQPVNPEILPQLREIPIVDRPRTTPAQAPRRSVPHRRNHSRLPIARRPSPIRCGTPATIAPASVTSASGSPNRVSVSPPP